MNDMLAIPSLSTGVKTIDTAFRVAVGTLAANIKDYKGGLLKESSPCVIAGLDYDMPWTRDASFSTWFCAGLLAPAAAKNSLLSTLVEAPALRIWEHNYWDNVIWAWGAWNYYLYSGDREFLKTALPAVENTLSARLVEEQDPVDKLFRGGACFQDGVAAYPDKFVSRSLGSGIEHCLEDHPPFLAKSGKGLPMKALSTNCLYLMAFEAANWMRRELGLPKNETFAKEAELLRKAIWKNFWSEDLGSLRYLLDADDPLASRQEGLGVAFALLAGVVPPAFVKRLVGSQHVTRHGLPCVWPSYERYAKRPGDYGRHSGTIWPQVNATWVNALSLKGFRAEAFLELSLLSEKVARDMAFYEIYHPETGLPYGGLQENGKELGIVEWKSCRWQTWCATGFINMVLSSVFGLRFSPEGLTFSPYLPEGMERAKLEGLPYRNALLDIEVVRGEVDSLLLNGQAAKRVDASAEGSLKIVCAVALK